MKKTFRVFIVILLTVTAGVFFYQKWKTSQSAQAWAFIPENAVLIAEIHSPLDWLEANQTKPAWTTLAALPYSQKLLGRLNSLRTISPQVADFLKSRQITLSAHVTAHDDFDYLFYIPLGPSDYLWLKNLFSQLEKRPAYHTSYHHFQGKQIAEISTSNQGNTVFSYLIHNNYLVGSYTPFLVEDAIRSIDDQGLLVNRQNPWNRLEKPSDSSEKAARLYVNMTRLSQAASVFTPASQADYWRTLSSVAEGGIFSVQSDGAGIRLRGRLGSLSPENRAQWLNIFDDQPARPLRMRHLIPEETAILFHYSFQNARRLFAALEQYAQTEDPAWIQQRKDIRNTYDVQLSPLYDWVGQEIALGLREGDASTVQRVVWVETHEPDKAISQLSTVAAQADRMNGSGAYLERYGGTTIRQIGIPNFPLAVFGSLFAGFGSCYYAPVKGYIIFANEVSVLKGLLDQVDSGEVWSNSIRQRSLLQQAKPDANFSVFVRTSAAWNLILSNLSSRWQEQFIQQSVPVQSFEEVTLQLVSRSDFYETDLILHHPQDANRMASKSEFLINRRLKFDRPLQSQVFVVKNPSDQRTEMLVQDEALRLHFISGTGEKVGQKTLDSPIVSGIYQVDLHQDGNLQFVFATERRLCLLDRQGHWVAGFPLALPDEAPIHTLAIMDDDQSKAYQFLVSDTRGNLYMIDQTGNFQEGWQPKVLGHPLSAPVRHVRVQGLDYLLVVQQNGTISVLNAKGEPYAGFPIALQSKISSPLSFRQGASAESSELTCLTDNGELVQTDLLGHVQAREQMARDAGENSYRLCPETTGKGWVVMRRTPEKVTLLGNHSSIFFEKVVDPSQNVICQYYDFGTDRKIFALTLPLQKHTLLCDAKGNLIGNRPIDNQFPVSVMYSEVFNKFLIFRASGNEAGIWTIKVR